MSELSTLAPRIRRVYRQRINARAEAVFPLLCPVMEKQWLPGWDYRMIHSKSGRAELGAVFSTDGGEAPTLWLVTRHEAPREVAFARWQPEGIVVHLEIALSEAPGNSSEVDIAYTYTAVNAQGAKVLGASSEEQWREDMAFWESSMNAWLAAHPQWQGH